MILYSFTAVRKQEVSLLKTCGSAQQGRLLSCTNLPWLKPELSSCIFLQLLQKRQKLISPESLAEMFDRL